MRLGTCGLQHATDDSQRKPCNVTRCIHGTWQRTACTTCDTGHWGGHPKMNKRQRAFDTIQRTACADDTQGTTCKAPQENVQQTPRNMQRATGEMQQTTRIMHHTTSRRHAPCSGQYTANSKRPATRNMQHAPRSEQQMACGATCSTQ